MSFFLREQGPQAGVDEFWRETEEVIGEDVLAYGLAQYHSGGDEEGPLWGLIYVTATRLFFRHFPQENWFSSVLGGVGGTGGAGGGPPKKSAKERDVSLEWALSDYSDLVDESERGGVWNFFFGKNTGRLSLVPRGDRPFGRPVVFTVEHERNAVIAAVRQGLAG